MRTHARRKRRGQHHNKTTVYSFLRDVNECKPWMHHRASLNKIVLWALLQTVVILKSMGLFLEQKILQSTDFESSVSHKNDEKQYPSVPK